MCKIAKYIIILFLTIGGGWNYYIKAQTVVIPDANFVTYLQSTVPSAMSGNLLDTTNVLVTTTTHSIIANNLSISNIYGLQFFKSLTYLECNNNLLTVLPKLSPVLNALHINYNSLTSLPALPNTLTFLDCSVNQLINLPTLSNSLLNLQCNFNNLIVLQSLPSSLNVLSCFRNHLITLPILPNTITYLDCSSNSLTSLPILPTSLTFLNCSVNQISSAPVLPVLLYSFRCNYNQLISLPSLPLTIKYLGCEHNQLTNLPMLPDSMIQLVCNDNNINCFPPFPINIRKFPNWFNISNNPYTCLPNYIPAMSATSLATPLCNVEDNCPVATDAPSGMLVPNIFTPNNDGVNDYFYVKAHNLSNFNCNIYNRWGTLVFQYSDVNSKWNGNNQSELPCVSGVYFYQITYTNNDNQTVPKTGTIQLLR